MRLNYLRILYETAYTKLCIVKDINSGQYYVEKSLKVAIEFQRKLFENEVNIHSILDNKYIIKFGEKIDEYRFLMEYAVNGNLLSVIHSNEDEKYRLKRSIQFLKGLAYLHEMGYVHNDIKPSNILITKENRAKLADFAFSGKIGLENFNKSDIPGYFVLGTENFKPPREKFKYDNLISNDIYAVGMVLYLLFSNTQTIKPLQLNSIKHLAVKEIVNLCVNHKIKDVNTIIKDLSHR